MIEILYTYIFIVKMLLHWQREHTVLAITRSAVEKNLYGCVTTFLSTVTGLFTVLPLFFSAAVEKFKKMFLKKLI